MNKYLLGLSVLALGLCACSDEWDDHYKVMQQGDGNLWKVISSQSDLSNFAKLLQATNFDRSLSSSQVFTVFAPSNDVFGQTECDSLINEYNAQRSRGIKDDYNTVMQEFVMNHVALFNYSVSSTTNDSIIMMNGKYKVLGANDLSGIQYQQTNQQCSNGVLFKMQQKLSYLPNIYEYVKLDPDLDSVASFLKAYEYYEFSETQSVPGDIVNGKTTYLDSVSYLYNMMFDLARINSEDSSYLVLLPDNEVWKTELEKHQKHFVYGKDVVGRDSLSYLYPRLEILEGVFLSATNNPVRQRDSHLISSFAQMRFTEAKRSMYSYRESDFYYNWTADGLGVNSVWDYLYGGTEQIDCSNGSIYKMSGAMQPLLADLWLNNGRIHQEAESNYTLDSVYTSTTRPVNRVSIPKDNPYYDLISEHSFIEISPTASAQTKSVFSVYNVMSNVEYDIYVVTVPPLASDIYAKHLANNFRVTLMWNNANGVQQKKTYPGTKSTDYFSCDSLYVKADYVCSMTFPTSSVGLEKPEIKIQIDGYTNPTLVRKGTHSTTTRIDKFVFIPKKQKD